MLPAPEGDREHYLSEEKLISFMRAGDALLQET